MSYMCYITTDSSICGGVLLNSTTIITAAHCVFQANNVKCYLNVVNRMHLPQPLVPLGIFIHPQYDNVALHHDLAILKITPIHVSTFIEILREPLPIDTPVVVRGWGMQRDGKLSISLRDVHVKIQTPESCSYKYGPDFVQQLQVCAGDTISDFCVGDSGGPLIYKDKFLVGIVSYTGQQCADGKPSVYTKLSSYIPWIQTYL